VRLHVERAGSSVGAAVTVEPLTEAGASVPARMRFTRPGLRT